MGGRRGEVRGFDWEWQNRRDLRSYVVANIVVINTFVADTCPMQTFGAARVAIPPQLDRWTQLMRWRLVNGVGLGAEVDTIHRGRLVRKVLGIVLSARELGCTRHSTFGHPSRE